MMKINKNVLLMRIFNDFSAAYCISSFCPVSVAGVLDWYSAFSFWNIRCPNFLLLSCVFAFF